MRIDNGSAAVPQDHCSLYSGLNRRVYKQNGLITMRQRWLSVAINAVPPDDRCHHPSGWFVFGGVDVLFENMGTNEKEQRKLLFDNAKQQQR